MALHYAIKVVDGYAAEIREAGLDAEGFCQGVLLKDALRTSTNERMDAQAITPNAKSLATLASGARCCCKWCRRRGRMFCPRTSRTMMPTV